LAVVVPETLFALTNGGMASRCARAANIFGWFEKITAGGGNRIAATLATHSKPAENNGAKKSICISECRRIRCPEL
jgi:hypothetical protein